jgi:hypothetical protein
MEMVNWCFAFLSDDASHSSVSLRMLPIPTFHLQDFLAVAPTHVVCICRILSITAPTWCFVKPEVATKGVASIPTHCLACIYGLTIALLSSSVPTLSVGLTNSWESVTSPPWYVFVHLCFSKVGCSVFEFLFGFCFLLFSSI